MTVLGIDIGGSGIKGAPVDVDAGAMLAVAAYPIIYAFWLSLNKADLRRPNANEFIGFDNYVTVLSSPIWWRAFGVTLFITVVSAFFELVFGMLLAIIMAHNPESTTGPGSASRL